MSDVEGPTTEDRMLEGMRAVYREVRAIRIAVTWIALVVVVLFLVGLVSTVISALDLS